MRRGSVTLGDLAARIAMLEVACSRCERRGRLQVDLLVAQYGDAELPELRLILAGDCPKAAVVSGTLAKLGVRRPPPLAGVGRWSAGISARNRCRACRCRGRSGPGAADRPRAGSSASAATCSCGGGTVARLGVRRRSGMSASVL